jgi:hypothetical protein
VAIDTVAGETYRIAIDGRSGLASSGKFKFAYHPIDFAPGWTVSGTVKTSLGVILAGSPVTARNQGGSVVASAVADSSGNYLITLPQGVNSFSLASGDQSVSFSNISQNQTYNFVFPTSLRISVIATSGNLSNLPGPQGVSVKVDGSSLAAPTQCAISPALNGGFYYVCPGLLKGGTYSVTPTHPTFSFLPRARSFVNIQSNLQNQSFDANTGPGFNVSGNVKNQGVGIPGAIISTGTPPYNVFTLAVTDVNGNFSIPNLNASQSFQLTAKVTGFSMSAPQVVSQANTVANFTATANGCSYNVTPSSINVPPMGGYVNINVSAPAGVG